MYCVSGDDTIVVHVPCFHILFQLQTVNALETRCDNVGVAARKNLRQLKQMGVIVVEYHLVPIDAPVQVIYFSLFIVAVS